MRRFWLALALTWACSLRVHAEAARVSMSTSSNRVAVGEPFAVEIRVETHGDDPDSVELPDFGPLQILGRSTARPFSFSFGFGGGQRARVRSETIYGFTLRATEVGAYSVRPAIVTIKGRRIASQPLNIAVYDGGANPGQGGLVGLPTVDDATKNVRPDDQGNVPPGAPPGQPLDGARVDQTMFLRTVTDKKRAFLGEQVTVTIYLYLRGQLGDSPQITREPTLDGFWSNDLLPMQRSLSAARQEVDGHTYSVYVLRRFAAFPLRTGKLEIGAPSVEVGAGGSIFDLLNGPGRPSRRDGVKVSVDVEPLPPQPDRGAATYTGTLSLEASLDGANAKVGEAVTLRVVAKGTGNMTALTLASPKLQDVEVLAPEIDDRLGNEHDVVGGERTFRWLLLPRSAGTLDIPSFVVDVFDPVAQRFSAVRSLPLTLTVTGPSEDAKPAQDDLNAGDPSLRFGPVRNDSDLARRTIPLDRRSFFWPLVLLAPLLLALFYGARAGSRRLVQMRAASPDSLLKREVEDRLEQAGKATKSGDANGALSALAAALKKAVEIRIGEPVGGMTLRSLEAQLQKHALEPQLASRIVAQLGALERARFDPGAQGALELRQALDGVRAVVQDLGKQRGA